MTVNATQPLKKTAELWFGEGRLPSAGRLVELHPRESKEEERREKKAGREEALSSSFPPQNTHVVVMLSITVTLHVALSQRHAHTHFPRGHKSHGSVMFDDTIWTCDGVRVRAGMRTRVAQAGRHHQQSTDDDDGG